MTSQSFEAGRASCRISGEVKLWYFVVEISAEIGELFRVPTEFG
jgi:hypothetical protein